jgi:hypothetical protein
MHQQAGEFVAVMLHSATATHLMHLATKSYAEHMALGAYYEAIVDLVDKFAETFQGKHGVIPLSAYPGGFAVQKDCVGYAETLLQFAKGARKSLPDDSELQNIIDEIVAEVATLLYKCKTFK